MTNKDSFEPVTATGWMMGFSTLFKKELKTWFGTKSWWQQALLWSVILGMFGSVGFGDPEGGLFIFYMMAIIFPSIAVIIVSQERILEDKRSGSAAWVLSKPVSRIGFILSKLLPSALGFAVSMVLIPGILVYLIAIAMGQTLSLVIYLASLVPLVLWQIFLSWLTMCLGTFFEKEGPVMAAPFLFLFLGPNLAQYPGLGEWGPWGLVMTSIDLVSSTSFSMIPVLITIGVLVMLAIIAIVRFRRHEF